MITVIICTHNPRRDYLDRVLNSLKLQTFPKESWELLLIDNASELYLDAQIDLSWHSKARHIREEILGLTAARLRGIKEARNDILVFVDDDNILDINYLNNTIDIMQKYPNLGAVGGKSLPEFEIKPEDWVHQFYSCLALRDLGDETETYFPNLSDKVSKKYPEISPIGAGIVLVKQAAQAYAELACQDTSRLSLGRTGKKLVSGEDNDIVLTLLEHGWGIGYFPQLRLTHLISANRVTKDYLAKLNYASSRSWIQVLDFHKIRPWKKISSWTVMPRKIKAFFNYQAWKNPESFVKWRGACGTFEALARLS